MKNIAGCVLALLLSTSIASAGSDRPADPQTLRFGLTPVFLDDQVGFLRQWREYLEQRLGRPVEFVQRRSYQEISELLLGGELDVAWTCGFPYAKYRSKLQLVSVPLYRGKPLYRSYLITAADNTPIQGWQDLAGTVFAYSDPDSNSGHLYPLYRMNQLGIDPQQMFRRTFFAWEHRNVVEAVAAGLADAGAVDGYVWETLAVQHPELTDLTRVVSKSPEFGFPPIVARQSLPRSEFEAVRNVLGSMAGDPAGMALLEQLNLNGFSTQSPSLYDSIYAMMVAVVQGER